MELESAIDSWCESNDWNGSLVIDLSEAEWIDVAALMHIVAIFADRSDNRLQTSMRIPNIRKVRDFLRVWRFAQAVQIVTDRRFKDLVDPVDHQYFEKKQVSYSTGNVLGNLEAMGFFGFMVFRMNQAGSQAHMIQESCQHWDTSAISGVLHRYLSGSGKDFARVVVYESISNAYQHPNADTVCVVSKVDGPDRDGKKVPTSLTLCVWDNGSSIADTLKNQLMNGHAIRVNVDPSHFKDRFLLVDDEGIFDPKNISASSTPNLDSPESEFLLSSMLPGITRRGPYQEMSFIEEIPELLARDFYAAQPGMGLFALLQAAIKSFGGKVTVRSGNLRLSVREPKPDEKQEPDVAYRVKCSTYPPATPRFRGNMITIRLPLSDS